MKEKYTGYTLLHQYELDSYKTKEIYVRPRDVSTVTIKTIGNRILTELRLNCQQVIFVTESLEEVMNKVSTW